MVTTKANKSTKYYKYISYLDWALPKINKEYQLRKLIKSAKTKTEV